jgi:hypothetical protein
MKKNLISALALTTLLAAGGAYADEQAKAGLGASLGLNASTPSQAGVDANAQGGLGLGSTLKDTTGAVKATTQSATDGVKGTAQEATDGVKAKVAVTKDSAKAHVQKAKTKAADAKAGVQAKVDAGTAGAAATVNNAVSTPPVKAEASVNAGASVTK